MIGAKQIFNLRINGYTPSTVWVHVLDTEQEYFSATHPEVSMQNGFFAEIHITPRDKGALDFRCLTGLVIHLIGTDERKVLNIMKQIQSVNPKRIITSLPNRIIDSANMPNVREAA